LLIAIFAAVSPPAFTQQLPDKIRGYRVHEAKIRVESGPSAASESGSQDAIVRINSPEIIDFGLSGVTFQVGAEIGAIGQSGNVDFLTFNDFRINGISVDIDEYPHSFVLKKNVITKLPKPAVVTIGSSGIAKAAYNEIVASRPRWAVTGTVFVFGKFKKFGIGFKRVVPVRLDLSIPNPLRR